jgi:predicted nuclease of predicted toxin-antitoxin system
LIWDELLSHSVPRALRELGFNTTYGGAKSDGAPPRRSSDAVVIEFARRTNQVIVTSNHDMMLLCDEIGQCFVWMDPRGRQFLREVQVLLCFRQIPRWEEILESGASVRALRTKAVPIESAEAARLANQRFRELRRRQRAAARRRATGQDHLRLQD